MRDKTIEKRIKHTSMRKKTTKIHQTTRQECIKLDPQTKKHEIHATSLFNTQAFIIDKQTYYFDVRIRTKAVLRGEHSSQNPRQTQKPCIPLCICLPNIFGSDSRNNLPYRASVRQSKVWCLVHLIALHFPTHPLPQQPGLFVPSTIVRPML